MSPPCRVTAYARDVVEGRVVAGRLVRLACQRHLDDLAAGPGRGLTFGAARARYAIDFFEQVLRLNGGDHEGKPFLLSPWQAFIVGSLFGWLGPDGHRRFRTAYCEVGKGNGKSPLAAGIGLKCEVDDGEPRAEVYAAATKKDQAMILFRDAVAMVDQSPALSKRLAKSGAKGREWNLAHHQTGSFFRPIASDDDGQSGPRPHCALIDEVHEHRTPVVIDMMRAGTKGRRQALIFEITNSGTDRASVCWQHHEYSAQILEGLVRNDTWFAFVCQLDPCAAHRAEGHAQPVDDCPDCDDWRDEAVWPKANPNLGVSVTPKYLREQVEEARGMPPKEGVVKRLNFCVWTQAATRAIPAEKWHACGREFGPGDFEGRDCFAALDIGATSDFTALALLFPHDDEEAVEVPVDFDDPDGEKRLLTRRSYSLLPVFWLPQHPRRRDARTAEMVEGWRRQRLIRTTPGESVDYGQVLEDVTALGARFPFRRLAVDKGFQGMWVAQQLLDRFGTEVVGFFIQGIVSFNSPFREFLELVKAGRFHHPGHPVLTWMAGNTAAEQRGGLMKPSKDHSPEKIDGITAAVMALGAALLAPAAGAGVPTITVI